MLRDKGTARVLVVSSGIFLALGMLVAIGPSLPEFARNNGVGLGEVGAVYGTLFLGAVPAQLASGWLNDRFGPRLVLGASLFIFALGLLGATLSRYMPLTLACMAFAGLGDGVLVMVGNVMVAQTFARRSASALNLLNVFYGVGAIAGPAVAGASLGLWGTSLPALWCVAGLAALVVLAVPGLHTAPAAQADKDGAQAAQVTGPIYRSPALWLLSVLLLLYVGVEVGTGGWIATYMQRTSGFRPEEAAFVASAFYMALTGGRLIAAALAAKLRSGTLLLLSLLLAVAGGAVMAVGTGNALLTIVSVLMLGASFGPIYPTALAIVLAIFQSHAGRASSIAVTLGSVGGIVLPWLQGGLLESVGVGSLSLTVITAASGMLLFYWAHGAIAKRTSIDATTSTEVRSVAGSQVADQGG